MIKFGPFRWSNLVFIMHIPYQMLSIILFTHILTITTRKKHSEMLLARWITAQVVPRTSRIATICLSI